jgi:hypothetical protein
MNLIGRRTIICMLLIMVLAVAWSTVNHPPSTWWLGAR